MFIKTTLKPNCISKPTTAAEHFLSTPTNHSPRDMLIIPLEKLTTNRESSRDETPL